MQAIVWATPSRVLDLTPLLIHIRAAWRGKLEESNINTLAKGIPNGKIETIPYGGKVR